MWTATHVLKYTPGKKLLTIFLDDLVNAEIRMFGEYDYLPRLGIWFRYIRLTKHARVINIGGAAKMVITLYCRACSYRKPQDTSYNDPPQLHHFSPCMPANRGCR